MRNYALAGLPLIVFLGIAGAVANTLYRESVEGYAPATIPSALIGQKHPAVDLPPLAGLQTPALNESVFEDQVIVLNIFASWCVPCRQEHPTLMQLSRDPRIKLVGVNYKDAPKTALAFLEDKGNPFAAIGVDDAGRNAMDWGVYGVPETFVIDRSGRITQKHVGPLDENSLLQEINPAIDAALSSGQRPDV
ncbi:thiol:disulfide interchange protein [Rhizobium sp. R72]|uniref:DsbE family thiol:disulfide interchange protein n=1 Tax=unclassified Rhizobium TaxID=2613769 RepID=UPI000B52EC21|nr:MULTISPECIES: DsbE family thiol:disulfide interchange protein [unclassified Rhizobium]OWV96075.1 thiol:disulfide interchange protein [Rhizobium sp. R72]OWV96081.1 thiol:disulfide interchange protein [Rhizobium sp. R711]